MVNKAKYSIPAHSRPGNHAGIPGFCLFILEIHAVGISAKNPLEYYTPPYSAPACQKCSNDLGRPFCVKQVDSAVLFHFAHALLERCDQISGTFSLFFL